MLSDVAFVLCLDTLGTGKELNLHVSKPPRDDSAGGRFYKASMLFYVPLTFSELSREVDIAFKKIIQCVVLIFIIIQSHYQGSNLHCF